MVIVNITVKRYTEIYIEKAHGNNTLELMTNRMKNNCSLLNIQNPISKITKNRYKFADGHLN